MKTARWLCLSALLSMTAFIRTESPWIALATAPKRQPTLIFSLFLLAIGIGIVAGLRSLLAPAVVAWAAHFDLLNLNGSPLAFMGSRTAVAIFSVLAIGELIADKLPKTPKRTALGPLLARILTG